MSHQGAPDAGTEAKEATSVEDVSSKLATMNVADAEEEPGQEELEAMTAARAVLDATPVGDPQRAVNLDFYASAIADYHAATTPSEGGGGLGELAVAINLTKEAIATSPETIPQRGTFYNSLQFMYWEAYRATGDPQYLNEAIDWGRKAFETKSPAHPEDLQEFLRLRRAALLARSLRGRFEDKAGGSIDDLDLAMSLQAQAADGADASKGPARFSEFCSMCFLKAEYENNIDFLESAINLRQKRPLHKDFAGLMNRIGLIGLLVRKHEWTHEAADLERLLDLCAGMFGEEFVTNKTPVEILTLAAGFQAEHWRRENGPVFDLSSAILLYKTALEQLKPDSLENLEARMEPLMQMADLQRTKYKFTKRPSDGYLADDIEAENSQTNVRIQIIRGGAKLEEVDTSRSCTVYRCCVTGAEMMLWGSGLRYAGGSGPKYFVRRRNSDGTLEIGATEEDRELLRPMTDWLEEFAPKP